MQIQDYLNQIIESAMCIKDLITQSARERAKIFNVTDKIQANGNECLSSQKNPLTTKLEDLEKMVKLKNGKMRQHNGVWEIRYRRDGYDKSFSAKIQADAVKKFKEFLSEIKNASQKADEIDTIEFVKNWFYSVKKKQVKPITFEGLESKMNHYVLPFLKNKNFKSITPANLQPYFNKIETKSTRIAEDVKQLFSQVFKYAIANRLNDINPMDGVFVLKHQRKNGVRLSRAEELEFLESIKGKFHELAYLIVLYTGCRPSELNSIEFDFENETISIKNAKLKSYQAARKENLTRVLPMFPKIRELRERIESKKERWRINFHALADAFTKLKTKYTLKDLRHTFATKAREDFEIDNEIVNLWQGHSQKSNQTATTYTHFSMEYQRKFAELMIY